jgi:hypothetical protein
MFGPQLSTLVSDAAPALDDALGLVTRLDRTLIHGLARFDDERTAALAALVEAFAQTPLHGRLAEAVDKVTAGSITDEHVAVLAGGRTALLGAVHDALLDRGGPSPEP